MIRIESDNKILLIFACCIVETVFIGTKLSLQRKSNMTPRIKGIKSQLKYYNNESHQNLE